MRSSVARFFALFPLFTVAVLWHAQPALAQQPRPAVAWYTDYQEARKEALAKGQPLIVVIGTDDCYYCRKLESGPLKDPTISGLLATDFVVLKLDANRSPDLAKALKVQLYPTTVLAGPDGKIHAFIEGYIDADRLADVMKRTTSAVKNADWVTRDFTVASAAVAAGDYPRAVALLKGIAKDRSAAATPTGIKAKQLLDDIEKLAAGAMARAKEQDRTGQGQIARDTLSDLTRRYAGTQAAADAAALLATLNAGERPEDALRRRQQAARALLASARDDLRSGKFSDCLDKCGQLGAGYADLPEAAEAAGLVSEIKSDPDRLAKASEQLNERAAVVYLALADGWLKKGQTAEAEVCWRKVLVLYPNSRYADLAQAELAKLSKGVPAVPVGMPRP